MMGCTELKKMSCGVRMTLVRLRLAMTMVSLTMWPGERGAAATEVESAMVESLLAGPRAASG